MSLSTTTGMPSLLSCLNWVQPSKDGNPPSTLNSELQSFFKHNFGIIPHKFILKRGKLIINDTEMIVSEQLFEYIKLLLI